MTYKTTFIILHSLLNICAIWALVRCRARNYVTCENLFRDVTPFSHTFNSSAFRAQPPSHSCPLEPITALIALLDVPLSHESQSWVKLASRHCPSFVPMKLGPSQEVSESHPCCDQGCDLIFSYHRTGYSLVLEHLPPLASCSIHCF